MCWCAVKKLLTHSTLSANLGCRSETCCMRLAENTGRKKSPKIRHLSTIAQLCRDISSQLRHALTIEKNLLTRMWANPNVMVALPNIGGALCSTPQFGWRQLLECSAATLPRRETRWNYLGCPKLTKWSQPLVGRLTILWGHVEEILLLSKFFSDCRYIPL